MFFLIGLLTLIGGGILAYLIAGIAEERAAAKRDAVWQLQQRLKAESVTHQAEQALKRSGDKYDAAVTSRDKAASKAVSWYKQAMSSQSVAKRSLALAKQWREWAEESESDCVQWRAIAEAQRAKLTEIQEIMHSPLGLKVVDGHAQ